MTIMCKRLKRLRDNKSLTQSEIEDFWSDNRDYLLGSDESDVAEPNIEKAGMRTEKELAKMRMQILLNTQENLVQNLSRLIPEDKRGLYEKLSLCMDEIIAEEAKCLS